MLKRVLAIIVVAAVLVGGLLFSQYRHEPLKVSGFIEADEIRVGSRVGGRVLKVTAVEGQRVNVGDPLVELEPYDLLDRRAEATYADVTTVNMERGERDKPGGEMPAKSQAKE